MNKQKKQNHLLARYIILLVGLIVMAFGVAFSIVGDLGTSPISSLPYVTGVASGLSVGTTTMIMHCAFVLLQIAILRKNFEWVQLLQILVAVVFGFFIDVAQAALSGLTYANYFEQWVYCAIGIVLVALGVTLEVVAGVVILAGEGVVRTICQVKPWKFGNVKVAFDVTLVVLSVLFGLIFLHQVVGVREGTVAAAIFVGLLSKVFIKPFHRLQQRLR